MRLNRERLWALLTLLLAAPYGRAADAPVPVQPANVVIIAVDTLRADHLGCYGYRRPTSPHIDKLAAEGVRFESCYSAASWTLPSFMSLFTGVMPQVHGITNATFILTPKLPTLAEKFRERGYFTAAVVSNPFLNGKYGFSRGFEKYDDFSVFLDSELDLIAAGSERNPGSELVTGESVARQAKHLLSAARKTNKSCFLFLHFFDPHDSYIPPQPYRRWVDPNYAGAMDGHHIPAMRNAALSAPDLEQLKALYDGEIAFNDELIGQVVEAIDATFDPVRTLIVLLGDHGEAFGEHGMLQHGNSCYREELLVPMIWRWPGILPKGALAKKPVSLLDLSATFRDLMRFEGMGHLQGRSLWPALSRDDIVDSSQPRDVFGERANDIIRTFPRHLVLTRGEMRLHARFPQSLESQDEVTVELYDVGSDPLERQNLAGERPAQVAKLRGALVEHYSQCKSLRRTFVPDGAVTPIQLNEKERRRMEGLGYLNTTKPSN